MALSKWEEMKWTKIGEGSYNLVYRSADGHHVFKTQQKTLRQIDIPPDLPDRSVRLWNELNPDLPAFLAHTEYGDGWICPYVAGRQAADKEISAYLITIYNTTGRIVADAPGTRNFLRTPEGRTICIDIGLALKMECREDEFFSSLSARRKSLVSLETWANIQVNLSSYYAKFINIRPITVRTIKALLFIKLARPDIFDVSFLSDDQDLMTQLAEGYDGQNMQQVLEDLDIAKKVDDGRKHPLVVLPPPTGVLPLAMESTDDNTGVSLFSSSDDDDDDDAGIPPIIPAILADSSDDDKVLPLDSPIEYIDEDDMVIASDPLMEDEDSDEDEIVKIPLIDALDDVNNALHILEHAREINCSKIKESCIQELKRYISLRGTMDSTDNFTPSWTTVLFRNQELTASKVGITRRLIDIIKKADSIQDIQEAIHQSLDEPNALTSRFTSGLETSLGKCMLMVELVMGSQQHQPTFRMDPGH